VDDVTQTIYQDTKPQKPLTKNGNTAPQDGLGKMTGSSKVNAICDAILRSLNGRKSSNLQNIITAHVCKLPPALDDGLTLVAELIQEDDTMAESAVEHICFLVDVNKLYEHALGLYNLDLTLLVAQQSQRDPREYLPFVQNLHRLPEVRRKFEIDDHLGRRAKALSHLKELDAFDELTSYTTKYELHQEALLLYRYDTARHKSLTDLLAAYLESKSNFREAGLAYESLGNFAKATACYRAAGVSCWQECFYTAQLQTPPLSGPAFQELATALADALFEAKDFASAAAINLQHLANAEGAVRCLCKGYQFGDALRLVAMSGQQPLLLGVVDAGLTDALSSSTEFLADCKAQLLAQVPRILELRKKAAEDPLSFYEGERAGGDDLPDNISVAASSRLSTSASLFTRYTGKGGSVGTVGTGVSRATSKNRKREEKKRARGRKGTVYEEEYLVNSVKRLVERVGSAKGEVERLVFALVRRDMAERARAIEALMSTVVEACRAATKEIFPPEQPREVLGEGEGDGWVRTGGDAVLQDHLETPRTKREAPIITDFKRLSLLGS
jgi:elongator complex protein 1